LQVLRCQEGAFGPENGLQLFHGQSMRLRRLRIRIRDRASITSIILSEGEDRRVFGTRLAPLSRPPGSEKHFGDTRPGQTVCETSDTKGAAFSRAVKAPGSILGKFRFAQGTNPV
jgi:hypothetical protein